jgi:hypothetical protein
MSTESATTIGCKLVIGRQFLQLYMSRRPDLESLAAPMLLHIMQAHARAAAAVSPHAFGPTFSHSSSWQQPASPTSKVEEEAKRIDTRVSGHLMRTYFTDH